MSFLGRHARAAAAAMVLSLGLAGCSSSGPGGGSEGDTAPFVLVHGAWMGAWAWDGVVAELRAGGAAVTAVELPAHGADTRPVQDATLDAYVAEVVAAIDAQPEPVVLVAHSMGGIVATEVAEQRPDRIAQLVYLAAFVPREGESLQSLAGKDMGSHIGPVLQIDPDSGTAKLPAEALADIFCADCPADEVDRIASHYRDEPLAPFAAPAHPTAARWGKVRKRYIYTEHDNAVSPALQQEMTAGVELAGTTTLPTSHSPFLVDPGTVAKALLSFQ